MDNDYRDRLESYLAAMLQAKRMLTRGILTPDEYDDIDTIIADKYGISSCSIYRGIDLIHCGLRGNMVTKPKQVLAYKGVTKCQAT